MDIAAVCLLRQLAWRCHLLLYRTSHHPREDAAALSHQATKYGTRPQTCTTLGTMDGTSLLAPYPWRSNTRHIRHHAFPSPPYQYHDANWTYPTLCCSIILSNGHKQANRIISLANSAPAQDKHGITKLTPLRLKQRSSSSKTGDKLSLKISHPL